MDNTGIDKWLSRPEIDEKLRPMRELQGVLLEMLKVLDDVCTSNGLCYYIFYGTLLGAMRHQGFIPWDDDADVVMPREDYDKLLRLPQSKWPNGYFLQSPSSDRNSRFVFAKLRKDGTTCITPNHAHIKMHHGIFVDIFPLDETWFTGWGLWWIPRFFERLTAFSCARLPWGGACLAVVQKVWMCIFPPSFFAMLANMSARLFSGKSGVYICTFCPIRTKGERHGWRKEQFGVPRRVQFDGVLLNAPEMSEGLLDSLYGRWREFPPEDKRIPVHSDGGIVDVHRDYSEYLK